MDADGNLWMSFGSFWGGIKLIQLDPATGKRIAPDSPVHALAHYDSIEAPFIYHHNGVYYLFLNWGMCCRGLNSTYNMRVGRSPKITGPYLDKEDKDMLEGGGTLLLDTDGPFIGPGHAGILEGGRQILARHALLRRHHPPGRLEVRDPAADLERRRLAHRGSERIAQMMFRPVVSACSTPSTLI